MLAELPHGCPLHCPCCSNPAELVRPAAGPTTEEWSRVFAGATRLGVVHAQLSGGEPLLRRDLAAIVERATDAGVYTQLVTGGLGLTTARLNELTKAGRPVSSSLYRPPMPVSPSASQDVVR
ncbi:radical SAM protein [Streptomyces sp. CA-249302]|uniref:radical SAM protein n=1 Tax=Streptomyces sp. CA-249302 TaxID=3240058 RepID=UPI003D91FA18